MRREGSCAYLLLRVEAVQADRGAHPGLVPLRPLKRDLTRAAGANPLRDQGARYAAGVVARRVTEPWAPHRT